MGLDVSALALLINEHKRKPFSDPILILGRQYVWVTPDNVCSLMQQQGYEPHLLTPEVDLRSNIPSWRGRPEENYISDVGFFRLLGLTDVRAMDYSDFEGADIVADLNQPVDSVLRNRFGLVLDGGVFEHVFDTRQALVNVASMVRPGGRVIHMSPVNNYINHGFYQFSPTLYFDYYSANGFVDLRGLMCVIHKDTVNEPWQCFGYDPLVHGGYLPFMSSSAVHCLGITFTAERTAHSTTEVIPVQSHYRQVYAAHRGGQLNS